MLASTRHLAGRGCNFILNKKVWDNMKSIKGLVQQSRNLLLLLAAGLLLQGCPSAQEYSSAGDYASSGNYYHYPTLDKGYQLWAIETASSRLRVFHPMADEAPFPR
jgi:uncharacterized protein YceK